PGREPTRPPSTPPSASRAKPPPPTSRSHSTSPLRYRTFSRPTTRSSTKRAPRWTEPASFCQRTSTLQHASPHSRQEFDMSDTLDWNAKTIAAFRANEGKVGGNFEGAPIVLCHHHGPRSGREYVNPVMSLPHEPEPDVIYVFATRGGAATNPDWYHNLTAAGNGNVERGTETYKVGVRELTGTERDRIYAEQARRYPGFTEYARQTAGVRTIPVLELARASAKFRPPLGASRRPSGGAADADVDGPTQRDADVC